MLGCDEGCVEGCDKDVGCNVGCIESNTLGTIEVWSESKKDGTSVGSNEGLILGSSANN